MAAWQFSTDWKAPGSQNDFWEPVFHPALANGSLYVPGAGGSIWKVNKATRHRHAHQPVQQRQLQPLHRAR